eukprot:9783194-Lingulodinium_polyedra.AAC.1
MPWLSWLSFGAPPLLLLAFLHFLPAPRPPAADSPAAEERGDERGEGSRFFEPSEPLASIAFNLIATS